VAITQKLRSLLAIHGRSLVDFKPQNLIIRSYGNLREVIRKACISEKFFSVVLLKRCGKRQIEFARERLVKAVNRLGVVRRNGRSRKVN
jgi:hypothetical protein